MTDPFSVTVGAITLCSSIITVAKSIQKVVANVRGALDQIDAIVSDVTELSHCLKQYEKAAVLSRDEFLFSIFERASGRLEDLKRLLERFSQEPALGRTAMRIAWLRVRKDAIKIRYDIKEIVQSLNSNVTANNAGNLVRVGDSLQMFAQSQEENFTTTLARLDDLKNQLEMVSQRDPKLLSRPFNTSTMALSPDSPSMNVGDIALRPQTKLYNKLGIGLSSAVALSCGDECRCRCHTYQQSDILGPVGNFLGFINFGFSGCSWRTSCDSMHCKRRAEPYLKLAYYLPRWLFYRRMVVFAYSKTPLGDPVFSLKVRRLVPMSSLAFQCCNNDDLEGLQQLFARGEATPNDVQGVGHEVMFAGNYSPLLSSAVRMGSSRVTEFLIKMGADVQLEDGDGRQVFNFLNYPKKP